MDKTPKKCWWWWCLIQLRVSTSPGLPYTDFTRRILIVTSVRFVIVDFKEMNEW